MPPKAKKTTSKKIKQQPVVVQPVVQDDDDFEPVNSIKQLDPLEAERWGRLDAEIRLALLGARLEQMQMKLDETEEIRRREQAAKEEEARRAQYESKKVKRIERTQGLNAQAVDLRSTYGTLCEELAEKHNIPREKMLIDPDLRTIRSSDEL
jgi:Tfp pilus assembly protein PilO